MIPHRLEQSYRVWLISFLLICDIIPFVQTSIVVAWIWQHDHLATGTAGILCETTVNTEQYRNAPRRVIFRLSMK